MRALLALTACTVIAAPLRAQSLADVCGRIGQLDMGQWAEYQVTGPQGEMQIRFASVGREAARGKDLQWLEMKMSSPQGALISQVLVPGFPFEQGDVEGMVVKFGDQPAMRVPRSRLAMPQGVQGPVGGGMLAGGDALKRCQEAEVVGREAIDVPAGHIQAVHFRSKQGAGDGEGWVSTDVPFGIVKLVWSAPNGSAEMVLVGRGNDAKSSITETPREMPGMGR